MIRPLEEQDTFTLMEYLEQESCVNYFILLGLERSKYEEMFFKKWGEFDENNRLKGVMLKRKTGNVQFYSMDNFDVNGFSEILRNEGFIKLIGEASIIERFRSCNLFSRTESGSYICKLEDYLVKPMVTNNIKINKLEVKNLEQVIKLYEKTFKGFATKQSMIEKLLRGNGRGYFIEEDNEIISVVQTAYEEVGKAVITGVATHPEHRRKGYGYACLSKLTSELLEENKILYLQYDDEAAGNMYKQMGYKNIGRMEFGYSKEVSF